MTRRLTGAVAPAIVTIALLMGAAGTASAATKYSATADIPSTTIQVCINDTCIASPPVDKVTLTLSAESQSASGVQPSITRTPCASGTGVAAGIAGADSEVRVEGTLTLEVSGQGPTSLPIKRLLPAGAPAVTIKACLPSFPRR